MDTADLEYDLPSGAIAQTPMEPRDAARLLVSRAGGAVEHHTVADLADLLDPGDVLVVNDTRVIPARLHLRKPTGGAVEVLLLERMPDGAWEALVRPSRRVAVGTRLSLDVVGHPSLAAAADVAQPFEVEVGETLGEGRRRVVLRGGEDPETQGEVWSGDQGLSVLDAVGEVPLPPYILEPLVDPERYQTVFAAHPGSVAAPTAGLHLTDAVLDRCRAKGVELARVELVVGLGTFRPIGVDRVEDHPMHAERYRVPSATQELLAQRGAGAIVAVGTTVVRALESWAASGETEGSTRLFIHGDYPFALVDRLLTNFHVPRSSLLALVQAFAGPGWRRQYEVALADGYRFLSFGDAMLLDRSPQPEGSAS